MLENARRRRLLGRPRRRRGPGRQPQGHRGHRRCRWEPQALASALQAAEPVLKGPGPFTVAPTDEAFANIPKADLDALLADKAKLTKVLTPRVVPGKVMATDVTKLKEAKTVEGQMVRIDASSGVKVNGASVLQRRHPR